MDIETDALLAFIKEKLIKSRAAELTEDTPLVSSGLIDSFSLPQLLIQLEKITNSRIPTGRVSPQDVETVRRMMEVARRLGARKA